MGSLPEADPRPKTYGSDAANRSRRLKRNLVVDLYLRRGLFWELVRDLRHERDILPLVERPPSSSKYYDLLLPQGAPNPPEPIGTPPKEEEQAERWEAQAAKLQEFETDWKRDLVCILEQVVPEWYRGGLTQGNVEYRAWRNFIAACILYDPPDKELLEFAAFCDPPPYVVNLPHKDSEGWDYAREVHMELPPVKTLRDPLIAAVIEQQFWNRVHSEVQKRHLEPLGLHINDMVIDVLEKYPEILDERRQQESLNEHRYYIEVNEHTSPRDVDRARQMIQGNLKRNRGGKPPLDQLVALQCAILHDKYNETDPTDRRVWRWTFQRLAGEFELRNARSAEEHVKRGRELLQLQQNRSA
jgi:hypothetical protein